MRVLYLDSKFVTPRKSAPTRAYAFARQLVERGHEVTMVGRDPNWLEVDGTRSVHQRLLARERIDGIDVLWLHVPYKNEWSKYRRIASYGGFMAAATAAGALLPRHDLVYASSVPLTIGVPGLTTSKLKRAPFVFELQDIWPAVPIGLGVLTRASEIRAAERLERTLYQHSARIIVCGETQREMLLERGVADAKIVVVPNFADVELFRPDLADEGWRASLGLEGKFVAIYTGGMGRSSGIRQAFDAAVALRDRGERKIAIVAYGDGSEKPDLAARAEQLGLDNLLFPAPVSRERIAAIVGAADVTLTLFAPYKVLEQNAPNKFFDGLAAAKPVVVNLDGWLRRIVTDNEAGVYVPAGDGPALAEALAELAGEPERVAELGRNGRKVAERDFARDLLADRMVDTLEEVVRVARPAA